MLYLAILVSQHHLDLQNVYLRNLKAKWSRCRGMEEQHFHRLVTSDIVHQNVV